MPKRYFQTWFYRAFNWQVLHKVRWYWVDYLRGIAIILVVYRHALLGLEFSHIAVPAILEKANMVFFSFRMPLFFIISGIFIRESMVKRSLYQLIGIKFENLFYPYLVWSFIQVSLQILLAGTTNANRSLIDYSYILYHPRDLDQFWYLPALFNTSVVFMLIRSRWNPPKWVHLLLGLGLYLLSPYFQAVSMMSDWMRFYIFFAIGDAVSEFFFRNSTQRFLKNPWTLLLISPFFVLAQIYYLRFDVGAMEFLVVALVGCLSMFILSFRLEIWKVFTFLRVIGYHSLYIYVMHVMVTAGARVVLTRVFGFHDPVILLATCIFFGVTIPIVFYNLLIKDNVFWFLFSFRKRKPKPAPVADKNIKALAS
jgi:fucose 4-O-acetylase-like acetyltransferase